MVGRTARRTEAHRGETALSRILLAGVGSASEVEIQSGRPYFLLDSAEMHGAAQWAGLDLSVSSSSWRWRRYLWNMRSLALGRGHGGYQFTHNFLEQLWNPIRPQLTGSHVLNWTQLYPSSVVADCSINRSYYLDQTLTQLFTDYRIRDQIREDVALHALEQESEGYLTSKAVITLSEWARRSVLTIPGMSAERVHVIPPGANLPCREYETWVGNYRLDRGNSLRPLRLVFVGSHPLRKGLDRLLRSVELAREGGAEIAVSIVGLQASDVSKSLRRVQGVAWHGRIHKQRDAVRFMSIVSAADIGCLLSRAEAGGLVLREYQALGLAVLGPDVGGSPDLVLPGAGVLMSPSATDSTIASTLIDLANNRDRVDQMRWASWSHRSDVLWPDTVRRIEQVLR
jgi:glycosyltransferase involved in cell wall biosynthesis